LKDIAGDDENVSISIEKKKEPPKIFEPFVDYKELLIKDFKKA
jgi:hypothetical protein